MLCRTFPVERIALTSRVRRSNVDVVAYAFCEYPVAPPRPYWKGYLKLSLVSCPVAVYGAIASGERVAFKQINRQTGLKQQLVDEHTGDLVQSADKARG